MNKRRLGRGLEALLGREEGGFEGGSLDSSDLLLIAVDQIDANPYQPRRQFVQPGFDTRPQPPFTSDELITVTDRTNQNRLEHAVLT